LRVELLGREGTKTILHALADKGSLKFTDLRKLIGSPTTTSDRLRELIKENVVKREVQSDRYRTVMYSLTKKGFQVVEIIKEIERM